MELKRLGNTNVMVPEIGLGVWKYRGGVEPLRRGIELGAVLIDTAEMYRTEDVVGQAVKGIRDRVFIATKVSGSHLRYDEVLRAAEASLHQLDTDYIDLYQIHWPNSYVPIKETMRAMETLVDRRLVKFIGVSNFSVSELRAAQATTSKYPIVSNQVLYNLNSRDIEQDLFPYCQKHDVTIIAYTPLDDGRLATPSRSRRSPSLRVLEQVTAEVQKTPAQVALNWCTSRSHVIAIPKSDSVTRTEENCQASGWRLSPAQSRRLDEAFS
ncbi:MAG TPA: aldo/keto reductase [Candidatus Binatia bacterium]|jgi:diketogulonate reductase-like aldo/keto reductase|nr:aldo/keto reductase [Candidatus Binatia bacterium]